MPHRSPKPSCCGGPVRSIGSSSSCRSSTAAACATATWPSTSRSRKRSRSATAPTAAYADIAPVLLARDRAGARSVERSLMQLGRDLELASRGGAVADPAAVRGAHRRGAGACSSASTRQAWQRGRQDCRLRRHRRDARPPPGRRSRRRLGHAPSRRGSRPTGSSSSARSSGCAGWRPSLFQEIEGLFWYGAGGHDGLVQLIKRKATAAELVGTRLALDDALRAVGGAHRRRAAVVDVGDRRTARSSSSARVSRPCSSSRRCSRASSAPQRQLPPSAVDRSRPGPRRQHCHVGRRPDPARRRSRASGSGLRRSSRSSPSPSCF